MFQLLSPMCIFLGMGCEKLYTSLIKDPYSWIAYAAKRSTLPKASGRKSLLRTQRMLRWPSVAWPMTAQYFCFHGVAAEQYHTSAWLFPSFFAACPNLNLKMSSILRPVFHTWICAPTVAHVSNFWVASSNWQDCCVVLDILWHNSFTMNVTSARSWVKNKHLAACDL